MIASAALSGGYWIFEVLGQTLLPALTLLVPLGLVLVGLALTGRAPRWQSAVGGVCLLTSICGFIVLGSVNSDARIAPGQADLKIYQHNVWDQNLDLPRLMKGINSSDADIVALIEARPDRFDPYADTLRKTWPYELTAREEPEIFAYLRLLSKYEIVDGEVHHPGHGPNWLRARIKAPAGDITVMMVHFSRPWPFRPPQNQMEQLARIEPAIKEIKGPLILLGDFNSPAWGRLSRAMQAKHGFTLVNKLQVGTWPDRYLGSIGKIKWPPFIRWPRLLGIPIDLAFCRGGLVCANHDVGPAYWSDHHAIRFDVRFSENGGSPPRPDASP